MRMSVWEPMRDMVTLRDAMDRVFEETARTRGTNGTEGFIPPADAWETEDHVTIEMAVPGANPDSIEVTFDQGTLTVTGEIPARETDKTWVVRERARGNFIRRFNLNLQVDVDKAEANVENGILILNLPKHEEMKPRRISVKRS